MFIHGNAFAIDSKLSEPAYKQLARHLRNGIDDHGLLPGQLLPSTRDLSVQLGVSRATVLRSYEELLVMGYLESVEGIGTFVKKRTASTLQPGQVEKHSSLPTSEYAREVLRLTAYIGNLFVHDSPRIALWLCTARHVASETMAAGLAQTLPGAGFCQPRLWDGSIWFPAVKAGAERISYAFVLLEMPTGTNHRL